MGGLVCCTHNSDKDLEELYRIYSYEDSQIKSLYKVEDSSTPHIPNIGYIQVGNLEQAVGNFEALEVSATTQSA